MNSLQEVQQTVLGAIDDNRLVMNQVAYHINQEPPHCNEYPGFVPDQYHHVKPPTASQTQQANATVQKAAEY